MNQQSDYRSPAVAGQFYPSDQGRLRTMLEDYVSAAVPATEKAGIVRALIVPHAGYPFSGRIAAKGYALLRNRPDIVRAVVLAPSHRSPFGGISVGKYKTFGTPLGDIPVDMQTCDELARNSTLISQRNDAHQDEHALEVQLPFLQSVLGDFSLVPVACGGLSAADEEEAGRLLAQSLWRSDTIWIVSSDFTHYGRSFGYVPFRDEIPERLRELDKGAIDCIKQMAPGKFRQYIEDTGATICGASPISILLSVLQEARKDEKLISQEVGYATSGEVTGEYTHSVSYAAIAIAALDKTAARNQGEIAGQFELSDEDKAELLELARDSIKATLASESPPQPPADELSETLCRPASSFVTLHLDGRLRGCIGSLESKEPLYKNVMRNARNAAFHDPRFTALTLDEFEKIAIEISVLTPPRPISDPMDFAPGQHGIILKKGPYKSVFLPQVATEQGWDRETTLTHLALKAGLASNEWRKGAELEVFEAIVFH